MTTDYTADYKAAQGKQLFGVGVSLFGHGLIWFKAPGIFTLLPLSDQHGSFNIIFRAEIVLGALLTAYGMLVWRNAFRKLSRANYIVGLSCVPVLLLCASRLSERIYFLDQQKRSSISDDLAVVASQIAMVAGIAVFGAWWADSAHMLGRLRGYMRSSRFVK